MKQQRDPLTYDEMKRMWPSDFDGLKLSDDELAMRRRIMAEWSQQRDAKIIRLREEAVPILDDLRSIGFNVTSITSLDTDSKDYAAAIPILLKHLMLPYSDQMKQSIAYRLAVPAARFAWPTFVMLYRNAPEKKSRIFEGESAEDRSQAKDGLAVILRATVDGTTLNELIALAKDKNCGTSRILLLDAIKKFKRPEVREALQELARDPILATEIASWGRSSPYTQSAWRTLAAEYRQPLEKRSPVFNGAVKVEPLRAERYLAESLCSAATTETVGELIDLAKDPELGASRAVLLRAIKQSRKAEVRAAWNVLAADPTLATEIASLHEPK